MPDYPDNLIGCDGIDNLDQQIRDHYEKTEEWLPIECYDLVQCGYPYVNHGEMIIRPLGGKNEKNQLLPPKGMWCKSEDVKRLLKSIGYKHATLR